MEDKILQFEKRIADIERKLSYPMPLDMQRILEQVTFEKLKVIKLTAGLPIFTSSRSDTPKEGEIWILNGSVQFRSGGVTYTLTQATP